AYIFAVHVPIAGMSLLPILFQLPIVLLPAHIAFLELIIDPACSTVFESCKEEKDIMNRPPRNLSGALFNKKAFIFSLLQGTSVLGVVFTVFIFALYLNKGELEARTLAFVTLVFANIMLIITNLSWSQGFIKILKSDNRALWWVVSVALIALISVLYIPVLRNLFHFAFLTADDLAVTFLSGVVSLLWFEGLKALNKKARIVI
ncbi:MAG: cation-translocating P-type ATPase, partial [Candidatus Omnitrophica bacterium]|nr:cation-translocating P-type ATPase [Candidatus Omnitrophota bacterium]